MQWLHTAASASLALVDHSSGNFKDLIKNYLSENGEWLEWCEISRKELINQFCIFSLDISGQIFFSLFRYLTITRKTDKFVFSNAHYFWIINPRDLI